MNIYILGCNSYRVVRKYKNNTSDERIDIKIDRIDENKRIMTIEGKGVVYEKITEELKNYENTCN